VVPCGGWKDGREGGWQGGVSGTATRAIPPSRGIRPSSCPVPSDAVSPPSRSFVRISSVPASRAMGQVVLFLDRGSGRGKDGPCRRAPTQPRRSVREDLLPLPPPIEKKLPAKIPLSCLSGRGQGEVLDASMEGSRSPLLGGRRRPFETIPNRSKHAQQHRQRHGRVHVRRSRRRHEPLRG